MSGRGRRVVFLAGALPLALLLGAAMLRLPPSGDAQSRQGDLVVGANVDERHVTDAITAINFDYRGFDTLGEEFILFTAVLGVVLLLRRAGGDDTCSDTEDQEPRRRAPPTSDAVRALGLALVGVTVSFGLYIVLHGQLTPGGGFQGGVLVASAWLVLYLAGDARTFRRLTPTLGFEIAEAAGAGAYALIGAGGLCAGAAFLANVVPLGPVATAHSGGTIALLSVAVGVEVAGGFVLLLTVFIEEALAERIGR